ncbi:hypothetical protein COT94_01165 [Candidatus Falkowbacteria bacterium CG10_big_fil_rev_8_21_14_0_10_37_14]|uniref:DUF306 domain-containing protein n=1 Tax=Candidatus Falkowbacteria bacterium CG10_big_fil_rev_8_21_14_0_10_37_14 TaxID=1974561 RepID=A0A2M6WU12_9BACT|nr:META domain-containing protein [Candidatus Falkowbacteria bacterium]PIT96284.1 MAG: hypothetical protein COT94_01165 [Candidatus Falkowbacteria bacterium CG10_big_fil_rev_8_21_14_0_10_37_14]
MENKKCWIWAVIFAVVIIGGFYLIVSNQLKQISQITVYDGLDVVFSEPINNDNLKINLIGDWQLQDWTQIKDDTDLSKLKITLSFEADKFTAKICNRASGNYTINQNVLIASGAMTEMACENEDLMNVEGALMKALSNGMKIEIKSNLLVLSNNETGDRFVFEDLAKNEVETEKAVEGTENPQ